MISLNKESLDRWQTENLEHLRYEYPDLKPGEYCIDIGSYQKEWANEMISRYGVEVECFEALDNRAAWLFNGSIRLGGAYYYSSVLLPATGTAVCVDIAPYLHREVAVMKINIEGGEYALLGYILDKDLHKNIRNIQVQFHQVEGRPFEEYYNAITSILSQTHELTWRYPYCWENWRRKEYKDIVVDPDAAFEIENHPTGGIVYDTTRSTNHNEGEEVWISKPLPINPTSVS